MLGRHFLHFKYFVITSAAFFLLATSDIMPQKDSDKELFDMSLEELMHVKITTASKFSEQASDVPASIIIVTRQEIEKYGYTTLVQILENVPGFYNVNDYSYHSNFGVRGYWNYNPNRNLIIMVNGVLQGDDVTGGNLTETIGVPIEAIDRIEVIRGPMSVMYGSGGFYGAINIFTNLENSTEGKKSVTFDYGSNTKYKIMGRASKKTDDFSFSVNSTYSSTDGIDKPFEKMGSSGDIMGNGKDKSSKGFLGNSITHFDATFTYQDISFFSSFDRSFYKSAFLFQPLTKGTGNYEISSTFRGALNYKTSLSEKVNIDVKLQLSRLSHEYNWEIMADSFSIQSHPFSAFIAEMNCFYNPTDYLGLTFGVNYHSSYDIYNFYDLPLFNLNNMFFDTGLDPIITQAAYMQAKWSVTDKLLFVGGFRMERQLPHSLEAKIQGATPQYVHIKDEFKKDEIVFVPRLAAIYSLNEDNVVKLLYGEAVNRPGFFEKADMVGQSYPQLLPERIKTFELNVTGAVYSKLTFGVSFFRNELENLISRKNGFDQNKKFYSYWSNSGELRTYGFEGQLMFRPVSNLTFDFALTYQDTKDINNENIETAYSPKLTGYIKGAYSFWEGISFAVSGIYIDRMQTQWDSSPIDASNPNSLPKGRLGEETKPYFKLSCNLRVPNFPVNNMFINLSSVNILDSDIYYPTTSNSIWAPKGTLDYGRTFNLSVGYNF